MRSERGGLRADQVLAEVGGADDIENVPKTCGSWLASDGGLTADQSLADVPSSNCGSELAREGFLSGVGVLSG
jgi:hypothetical protein